MHPSKLNNYILQQTALVSGKHPK